jgi:hypothetical protein
MEVERIHSDQHERRDEKGIHGGVRWREHLTYAWEEGVECGGLVVPRPI